MPSHGVVLRGGHVLDTNNWSVQPLDVFILGDRIAAVGPNLDVPVGCKGISIPGRIVMPGLVNGHTHAHNNLIKGSGDVWTLEVFLHFGRALNANRTPEDQYVSAALGAIEMLKCGVTSVYDLFIESPYPTELAMSAVVQAYRDSGMRAIVAPAVADRFVHELLPGLWPRVGNRARDEFKRLWGDTFEMDRLMELMEAFVARTAAPKTALVRPGVSPTIPILCSEALLHALGDLAARFNLSIHTHLLETRFQSALADDLYGHSAVQHLQDVGLLGEQLIGAHGIWLTPQEMEALAESGAVVVHNPASNLKLGSGVADVCRLRTLGVPVAIGTDGCGSSDNLNMFEALRFAALGSRIRSSRSSDWLRAVDVLDMAVWGGARAMGLSNDLGKVAPGRLADLIVLNPDSVFLTPLNHSARQLVYCETGDSVEMVIVAGRTVVQEGRVLTMDESAVKQAAREAASRLRSQNDDAWRLAAETASAVEETAAEAASRVDAIGGAVGSAENGS